MKRNALKGNLARERRQLLRARLFGDLLDMVEIFEYFVRRAERLLEDIVDAHQPLHRLQQHDQREDEAREIHGLQLVGT